MVAAKFCKTYSFASDREITYQFFCLRPSTTYEAFLVTGVSRNSVTWYVWHLVQDGLLEVAFVGVDKRTGRKCKYYRGIRAADADKQQPKQLEFSFSE